MNIPCEWGWRIPTSSAPIFFLFISVLDHTVYVCKCIKDALCDGGHSFAVNKHRVMVVLNCARACCFGFSTQVRRQCRHLYDPEMWLAVISVWHRWSSLLENFLSCFKWGALPQFYPSFFFPHPISHSLYITMSNTFLFTSESVGEGHPGMYHDLNGTWYIYIRDHRSLTTYPFSYRQNLWSGFWRYPWRLLGSRSLVQGCLWNCCQDRYDHGVRWNHHQGQLGLPKDHP